jgi:hypothetical protein
MTWVPSILPCLPIISAVVFVSLLFLVYLPSLGLPTGYIHAWKIYEMIVVFS